MTLNEVYQHSDNVGIDVFYFPLVHSKAKGIALPDNTVLIDVDKIETTEEEKEVAMHEVAHIEIGTFYTAFSPLALKEKMEHKAKSHTIKMLVPMDELISHIKNGNNQIWELAEIFEVTPKFMQKAIDYYRTQDGFLQ